MWHHLKAFKSEESGAVTVDWVVLTAAIAGLAVACLILLGNGASTAGDTLRDGLLSINVN